MTVRELLSLRDVSNDNYIRYVKIVAETTETAKLISNAKNDGDMLVKAITIRSQSIDNENTEIGNLTVLGIAIADENTLTVVC